jgi:hypothetical protein
MMAQMRVQDALQILKAKLAATEQEHQAELAEHKELREPIDAQAEARALTAILDFLKNCKIAPGDSLLRIFRRYLRTVKHQSRHAEQPRMPHSRAG